MCVVDAAVAAFLAFFGIVHFLGEFDLSKDSHFIPLV